MIKLRNRDCMEGWICQFYQWLHTWNFCLSYTMPYGQHPQGSHFLRVTIYTHLIQTTRQYQNQNKTNLFQWNFEGNEPGSRYNRPKRPVHFPSETVYLKIIKSIRFTLIFKNSKHFTFYKTHWLFQLLPNVSPFLYHVVMYRCSTMLWC